MTLPEKWKEDEDEAIDISKDIEEEPDWKVVGSPSRRESSSFRVLDSPPNSNQSAFSVPLQQQEYRRSSISSDKGWGSFGGFQWEGPSIFDEELNTVPKNTLLPPNTPDSLYDPTTSSILSVPMLSNISLEPSSYKPQRSLSFSMGQEPNFFGYDNNSEMYARSALAPTMEEDEEHDSFDDAYLRTRSQSSNAVFGINNNNNSASYWNTNHRPTMPNRRSSLGFVSFLSLTEKETTTTTTTVTSNTQHRRMSQPEYNFNDIIPNGPPNSSSSFLMRHHQLSDKINPSKSVSSSIIKQPTIVSENMTGSLSTPQQQQVGTAVGKGMLLLRLPARIPLYMVEFKSGRTDFYYVSDPSVKVSIEDLVIVEADRGEDLGKVATDILSVDQVVLLQNKTKVISNNDDLEKSTNDSHVKRIYRQALPDEINMLNLKDQDEQKALSVCLQKINNRKLPMEVVDAEFQWDRRKLTFYFIAERRIDFRELVRELFKIYKTRIWM
ncbi:PSP1 C-terminal conserved region-domain-containing protein [Helicostylum pulchrum]|nr:PSP1 C-terminal conserved region-domain-containing protein [Helicostylum pulchrum]